MNQAVWRRKTARLAGEVTEQRRGAEGIESKTRIKDADKATRPLDTHTRVPWTVPLARDTRYVCAYGTRMQRNPILTHTGWTIPSVPC